ncbi:hypothetical protein A176_003818 [Myxococcus hansupus]|uniref:Uncharacterized protein n=1 Tax=Pseudomyxococcus hansupus TaxID=1297742 RepID=A0A0H4WTW3_9BACT|nr:hypothetical protein A176_003818 [Myxococcus hansupus]
MHDLWLYTEQTVALNWVFLRPGESCDLPCGQVYYTIGASFDEPDPGMAIASQVGFVAGVMAVALLVCLPEPGSKAAIAAYLVGAMTTAAGTAAGAAVMAISNQSAMKRTGVLANLSVCDIESSLDHRTTLADGEKLGVYSFRWTDLCEGKGEAARRPIWDARHEGFAEVKHGVARDVTDLAPVDARILETIRADAAVGTLYLDAIEAWDAEKTLSTHVRKFGGEGGKWQHSMLQPGTGNARHGLISGVRVAACKFIDGIQVKYSNRLHWESISGTDDAKKLGIFRLNPSDNGGTGGQLVCGIDEYFEKIIVKHDKYVCQLEFITNKGNSLKVGGRDGDGDNTSEVFQTGMGWIGYEMKWDAWVDNMSFVIGGHPTS